MTHYDYAAYVLGAIGGHAIYDNATFLRMRLGVALINLAFKTLPEQFRCDLLRTIARAVCAAEGWQITKRKD